MLVVIILFAGLSGCRNHRAPEGKRYDFTGKVVSVDERGHQVIISHEAIPGYMEAMTMPFTLKDEWAFNDLQPGDRVQATLVVADDRSWLEDLVITRETPDPAYVDKPESRVGPSPGEEVPDFALVNQDGKPTSLHNYRGRALALTFIYTRCPLPDYCPLMTRQFAEIEKALKDNAELYKKTQLLSITVDPEYDTPKVLRGYGQASMGTDSPDDFKHWEFATGTAEQVKKVAEYFGLNYWAEGAQIIHGLRTAVITPDGKVLKVYRGNDWKPADILKDLREIAPQT